MSATGGHVPARGQRPGRTRRSIPSPRAVLLTVLGSAALAGGLLAWRLSLAGRSAVLAPGAMAGSNVLLITIDTLRVDRVGAYGGGALTPTIDALAADGVKFERAYAHAAMTLPSHASILTGRRPPSHQVRNNGTYRLPAGEMTLAERLTAAGYHAGAFVGSFVLDSRFGLNQGFGIYDEVRGQERAPLDFRFVDRPAGQVLDRAERWILSGPVLGQRWFAWIHLFDPHTPYAAPEKLVADPYENEIAYLDRELGRFLASLRRAGALDRTLIVVTADHGEALGDHDERTHGLFAYDSTIHVPLVINGPLVAARVDSRLVSHVDIVPTVLDLTGIPVPGEVEGRPLLTRAAPDAGRAVYFEALDPFLTRNWAPLTGVIVDRLKYIELPVPELYDLGADPAERVNLAAREPERVRQLVAALKSLERVPGVEAHAPANRETVEKLRALGYVSGQEPAATGRRFTAADDPKNLTHLNRQFLEALEQAEQGDIEGTLRLLARIIDERPDFAAAYTTAASVQIASGEPDDAVAWLERALKNNVRTPAVQERLGAALLAAGRAREAIATLQPIVRAAPSVDALNTLGVAYSRAADRVKASGAFREALRLDPRSPAILTNLGLLELEVGDAAAAATAFKAAIDLDPDHVAAWRGLGAALLEHDRAAAIEAWRRAVEIDPSDMDTLFNVGMLLAESPQRSQAVPYLRRFLDTAPADRYAADLARVRRLLDRIGR